MLKQYGDEVFLAFAVTLSVYPYLTVIGFYSDDWAALSTFRFSKDQSVIGIFNFAYDDWVRMRPGQVLNQVLLYKAFDLNPLGYHISNTLVILASTLMCNSVLQKLIGSRLIGLSIALLYSLLPHYSADRFWFAAFQATLSVALYFLSLCAALRAAEIVGAVRVWLLRVLSIACSVASALCYELTIPLLFLNPLWVFLYHSRRTSAPERPHGGSTGVGLNGIHWAALVVVIAFKFYTTQRLGSFGFVDQTRWFGNFVVHTGIVSFGYLGVLLPWTALTAIADYPDRVALWSAATMAVLVFGYLHRAAINTSVMSWECRSMIVLGGIAIFGAGYAIFLTQRNVIVGVTTGIGNRIAIVAALGVAMSVVGGIGWFSAHIRRYNLRGVVFAGLMTVFSVAGLILNNIVASFWIEAYEQQKAVLATIRNQYREFLPGSALIVDGICPYVGPGIVFESYWDLAGALQILYHERKIDAHVVVPDLKVTDEGLLSTIYGEEHKFLYGSKLHIFDMQSGRQRLLEDKHAACEYFRGGNREPARGCPRGAPGYGVPILRSPELPLSEQASSKLIHSLEQSCGTLQASQGR